MIGKVNFLPFLSNKPIKIFVQGSSMVPYLQTGDAVFVIKTRNEEIEEGDLIVFKRGNEIYVHRAIIKEKEKFYEVGDNQILGSWIDLNSPLGKVVSIERKEGTCFDLNCKEERKLGKRMVALQKFRRKKASVKNGVKIKIVKVSLNYIFSGIEYLLKLRVFSIRG